MATAQELYPQYAWALQHPELGPILQQAAAEGWDSQRLQGAIYKTQFWTQNSESARNYFMLSGTDNAEFWSQIQQLADRITSIAKESGVGVGVEEIYGLAKAAMWRGQTSDSGLRSLLFGSVHINIGPESPLVDQVGAMAAQYGLNVSPDYVQQMARDIGGGGATTDTLRASLAELAKGKYPGIAKLIDQGQTPQQIANFYFQQAAQDLGVSPDSMTLDDPKWNVFFNQPGKDGPQLMSLYDWQRLYRTDPSYNYDASTQAKQADVSLAGNLAQKFGLIA